MAAIIIEVIFEDGSSHTHTYQYTPEHEALMHAWHEARITGNRIQTVHRMANRYTTLPGAAYPMIDCEMAQ